MKNTFLELSHPSQKFRVFLHNSLEKATRTLTNSALQQKFKKKKKLFLKKKRMHRLPCIATEAVFPIGLADRQKQISAL